MPALPNDFRVRYRFLTEDEGGRQKLARQGYRPDWKYAVEREPLQAYMIWPSFEDENGIIIADGSPALPAGTATMTILDPTMRPIHRERIRIGTRGFFVEGSRVVAEAEVTEVLGLISNPVE